MEAPSCKKIKFSVISKEDMKMPLSKINEDPEHYRTMLRGAVVYSEDLKHIKPQEAKAVDCEKRV